MDHGFTSPSATVTTRKSCRAERITLCADRRPVPDRTMLATTSKRNSDRIIVNALDVPVRAVRAAADRIIGAGRARSNLATRRPSARRPGVDARGDGVAVEWNRGDG